MPFSSKKVAHASKKPSSPMVRRWPWAVGAWFVLGVVLLLAGVGSWFFIVPMLAGMLFAFGLFGLNLFAASGRR